MHNNFAMQININVISMKITRRNVFINVFKASLKFYEPLICHVIYVKYLFIYSY